MRLLKRDGLKKVGVREKEGQREGVERNWYIIGPAFDMQQIAD